MNPVFTKVLQLQVGLVDRNIKESANRIMSIKKIAPVMIALWLGLFSVCGFAVEVDLTRFGPRQYSPDIVTPNVDREAFFGVPGKGRLIVTVHRGSKPDAKLTDTSIHVNGRRVFSRSDLERDGTTIEIPVQLAETNSIRVELIGSQGSDITVRVKQRAQVDLGVVGRIHFNISTADFKRSRDFYRRLGFADAIGPFPETNTIEVARGVGVKQPFRIYAELLYLGRLGEEAPNLLNPTGRLIDMIEWKDPRNESPAYPHLYHLGITRVVFTTTDLDADMSALTALGTHFLSPPAKRADGNRFVIGRDPDGTFFELLEPQDVVSKLANDSHVTHVHHLTINVSDFERSREFYRMFGFTSGTRLPATESMEVAQAMGLDQPYRVRAELMVHAGDGSQIELVEWQQPRDSTPPHPHPINSYGIQRINYATTDVVGDIAKLKALGVTFLSPIAPCCDGDASTFGFVLLFDPDGNFFQLMGAIDPE